MDLKRLLFPEPCACDELRAAKVRLRQQRTQNQIGDGDFAVRYRSLEIALLVCLSEGHPPGR